MCVKCTVGFFASRQVISGLHGEIQAWMPGKYLLLFASAVCMFLGSSDAVLPAVGLQAAFSSLLMGVSGCVLRIKLMQKQVSD